MASSSATTASLPTRRRSRKSEHSCLSCRGMHRCTTYITLLSVSLYNSPGVADAFSLVQNAAATSSTSQQQQQQPSSSSSSPDDAPDQAVGGEGTKTTTSNSLHRHTPFSAKAAAASTSSSSSNSSNGPFPVPGPFTATNSHNHHIIRNSHGNRPKYQPRTTSSLVASGVHGQHDSSASSSSSSFTDDFLLRMDNVMAEQWDVSKDGSSSAMESHQYHHCEGPSGSGVSSSSSSSPSPCSSDETVSVKTDPQETQLYERRAFLHGMLSNTATAAAVVAPSVTTTTTTTATAGFTSSLVSLPWLSSLDPAYAYEQSYPLELQMTPVGEVENASNSLTKLNEERLSSKKAKVKATQMELRNDPLGLLDVPSSIHDLEVTIAGAITWGLALWFASGSRSSPIVTPLANVLYGSGGNTIDVEDSDNNDDDDDDKKNRNNNDRNKNNNKSDTNQWLTDRNDGYFGELPPSFMAIVSLVFVMFGIVLDRAVYFLADGDADVSLQLGGVSVIGGAVWEVGRLAAKEKAPTREEYERDVQLYREFQEFADKRIIVGGRRGNDGGGGGNGSNRGRSPSSSSCSCHRSDVISAFRRYNPKYRTADNEQFPLSDIEIERILRKWNREFGSGSEMSPAGFFSGICVDGVADAFAPR